MANGGTLPQVGGMGIVQSPPILGQQSPIVGAARQACEIACGLAGIAGYGACMDICKRLYPLPSDSQGFQGGAQAVTNCNQCNYLTNIPACFSCLRVALTDTFFTIMTNGVVIIFVLMGVYMLVSGNSPVVGIRNAVGAAKKVGTKAAEVAVLA